MGLFWVAGEQLAEALRYFWWKLVHTKYFSSIFTVQFNIGLCPPERKAWVRGYHTLRWVGRRGSVFSLRQLGLKIQEVLQTRGDIEKVLDDHKHRKVSYSWKAMLHNKETVCSWKIWTEQVKPMRGLSRLRDLLWAWWSEFNRRREMTPGSQSLTTFTPWHPHPHTNTY